MKRVLTDEQWDVLRELAAAQGSPEQIAARLGLPAGWVRRRLGAEIEACARRGRGTLLRMQFRLLVRSHPSMLQWLGRQYASQRPMPDIRDVDRIILVRRIDRPEPPARRVISQVREETNHQIEET